MSELILLIGEYGIALKIIYEMIPLLTPYIILQVLELNLLEKLHETLKS